jgi:hypothetical protein
MKTAGFDLRKVRHIAGVGIDSTHYGGGTGKNVIDCVYATPEEEEKMQANLDQFVDKVLTHLKRDYNYLTSLEAIEETIDANDYSFLATGEMFS